MAPGRGQARVARGLTLSTACLMLPATAHVVAGGSVPTDGPFVFAAALMSVACVALADRQRSSAEIAMMITAAQPVLHMLLVLSSHDPGSLALTPGMVVAHAVAVLILTALLSCAEAVLWSFAALAETVLLRRLGQLSRLLAWSPEPAHAVVSAHTGVRPTRPGVRITSRSAPRRGPPVIAGT